MNSFDWVTAFLHSMRGVIERVLQGIVNKHLAQADVENEKSRHEMTSMKEASPFKSSF